MRQFFQESRHLIFFSLPVAVFATLLAGFAGFVRTGAIQPNYWVGAFIFSVALCIQCDHAGNEDDHKGSMYAKLQGLVIPILAVWIGIFFWRHQRIILVTLIPGIGMLEVGLHKLAHLNQHRRPIPALIIAGFFWITAVALWLGL